MGLLEPKTKKYFKSVLGYFQAGFSLPIAIASKCFIWWKNRLESANCERFFIFQWHFKWCYCTFKSFLCDLLFVFWYFSKHFHVLKFIYSHLTHKHAIYEPRANLGFVSEKLFRNKSGMNCFFSSIYTPFIETREWN